MTKILRNRPHREVILLESLPFKSLPFKDSIVSQIPHSKETDIPQKPISYPAPFNKLVFNLTYFPSCTVCQKLPLQNQD